MTGRVDQACGVSSIVRAPAVAASSKHRAQNTPKGSSTTSSSMTATPLPMAHSAQYHGSQSRATISSRRSRADGSQYQCASKVAKGRSTRRTSPGLSKMNSIPTTSDSGAIEMESLCAHRSSVPPPREPAIAFAKGGESRRGGRGYRSPLTIARPKMSSTPASSGGTNYQRRLEAIHRVWRPLSAAWSGSKVPPSPNEPRWIMGVRVARSCGRSLTHSPNTWRLMRSVQGLEPTQTRH